jgi:tRNA A37 threonylcarbamoyladenosine biosynthesis protein TsaE
MMKDMGNLVMLEWPERVEDALPNPDARIRVTPHEDGSRTISYG